MENLKDQLGEIKEQLFDAPTEVKSAFNTVVNYFSEKKYYVKARSLGGVAALADLHHEVGQKDGAGNTLIKGPFNTKEEAEKYIEDHKEELQKYYGENLLRKLKS